MNERLNDATTKRRISILLSMSQHLLLLRSSKTANATAAFSIEILVSPGTQTTEGAGLCVAFLRQMASMPRKPHVLMASHYQRHLYAFLADNPVINFLTFARHLADDCLVQLYNVVPGVTTSSFATFVSRDAGLVDEVRVVAVVCGLRGGTISGAQIWIASECLGVLASLNLF